MIITLEYYKDTYQGKTNGMSDEEILLNLRRAEDVFNAITQYRVASGEEPCVSAPQVRKAICDVISIICEDMITNGGYDFSDSGMTSVAVDSFSYSLASTASNTYKIPNLAHMILVQTGLMYRGIRSC